MELKALYCGAETGATERRGKIREAREADVGAQENLRN